MDSCNDDKNQIRKSMIPFFSLSLSGAKKIKTIHHRRNRLAAEPTNSREIKTELKYSSFKWIFFFPIASNGRTVLAPLMGEAKPNWGRVQHNVNVSLISCLNVLKKDKNGRGPLWVGSSGALISLSCGVFSEVETTRFGVSLQVFCLSFFLIFRCSLSVGESVRTFFFLVGWHDLKRMSYVVGWSTAALHVREKN